MNMFIETNIIVFIRVSSVSGLTFVFSAGSDALPVPFDGGLNDVYLVC